MQNTYVIFLDIDGTLTYDGTVKQPVRDAMARARALGHKVFVNTGRSLRGTVNFVADLPIDGTVTGIGTCAQINGETVHHAQFTVEELCFLFDAFEQAQTGLMFDGEDLGVFNRFYHREGETGPIALNTRQLLEYFQGHTIAKGFVFGQIDPQLTRQLNARFSLWQHSDYAEFCKQGYDKEMGMQKILQHYGLPRQACVAIGDSINDLGMLRYAGIPIAMGNGADEVKQICRYVTEPATQDGVATAIDRLLTGEWDCDKAE